MHDRQGVKPEYDHLPDTFPIEIDRPRLQAYMRGTSLMAWVALFGIFGAFFGFASIGKAIDAGQFRNLQALLTHIAVHTSTGLAIGTGLGLVVYFGFSHWHSARFARSLSLAVEGPFLRIKTVNADRKIHFRSIHDYAVIDGWMQRRFGVQVLSMSVSGVGQYGFISIAGVRDCLKVRDLIAEVDVRRENG